MGGVVSGSIFYHADVASGGYIREYAKAAGARAHRRHRRAQTQRGASITRRRQRTRVGAVIAHVLAKRRDERRGKAVKLGENTHGRVDAELSQLIAEAEREQRCFFGSTRSHRDALERRARHGVLVSPWPKLFARREVWDRLDQSSRTLHVIRALALSRPGTVFCGPTAALVYGLEVSHALLRELHVRAPGDSHGRRHGGARHSMRTHAIAADEPWWQAGQVLLTSPIRTVFDCARMAPFPHALAIADAALRKRLITSEQLRAYVVRHPRTHGIRRVREVVRHADGRAESGGESILRARMIELGYVVPELQVPFPDPIDPRRSYRIDLLVRDRHGGRVAIELDGRSKTTDEKMLAGRDALDVLLEERQRESRLTAYGLRFLRLRFCDVTSDERLTRLLNRFEIPKLDELATDERADGPQRAMEHGETDSRAA